MVPPFGNDIRVLDGGFGIQLVKLGHTYIDTDPLWGSKALIDHPEAVKWVHTRFLEAGADVILTNTYHINTNNLMKHLNVSESEAIDILKSGAHVARAAREDFMKSGKCVGSKRPLVAGSVGSYAINYPGDFTYGNAPEYHGNYVDTDVDAEGMKNWHRPRVAALIQAGVDIIAFETIPALEEAKAVCELIKEYPSAKAWMSFTLKDGSHICHGEPLSECVRLALENDQIVGLGVNCCPPGLVEEALKVMEPARGKKTLIVYPNSGESWTQESKWISGTDVPPLLSYVPRWVELGATWIGGCCRVYDTDIADISRTIQTMTSS